MMRRFPVMMAMVVVVGMIGAGCGSGTGSGSASGKRMKLPTGASAGGGAEKAAASTPADATATGAAAATTSSNFAPIRALDFRLAEGARATVRSAPAFRAQGGDELDGAEVARLAKALGLGAAPVEGDPKGELTVTAGERILTATTGPIANWNYQRERDGGKGGIAVSGVARACPSGADCGDSTPSGPPPTPSPPGLPSQADAEARATKLLADAGIAVRLVPEQRGQVDDPAFPPQRRSAQFTSVVRGLAVNGLSMSVDFGENGRVESAYGVLLRTEKVGDYDLVDLPEAVERVRAGAGAGGRGGIETVQGSTPSKGAPTLVAPVPSSSGSDTAGASGSGKASGGATGSGTAGAGTVGGSSAPTPPDEPTMTIEPQPVPPVELAPQVVELTGATLVLDIAYGGCQGESTLLVPAWQFDTAEGAGFSFGPVAPAVVTSQLVEGALTDAAHVEPCAEPGGGEPPKGKPEPAPEPAQP